MLVALQTGLAVLLVIVIFQDFQDRAISAWLIPALCVFIVGIRCQYIAFPMVLVYQSAINLLFLLTQLLLVGVYFKFRFPRTKIIDHQIGWGDILFLIPIAVLLPPVVFISFYVFSMLLVLLATFCWNWIKSNKLQTIPLAGGQALCLLLFLLHSWIF